MTKNITRKMRKWHALTVITFLTLTPLCNSRIPTTLDGPFTPTTARLGHSFPIAHAVDLPHNDPRLQKKVNDFEPEQIAVSLSATETSVWISWITGDFQIGYDIKPLDPDSVGSFVRYGRVKHTLRRKATGYSLIYNQLYPFEGKLNYTSGIIHHVRLTETYQYMARVYYKMSHTKGSDILTGAGLKPGTRYYYRCGDPKIGMSKVYGFRTMPVSGPKNYPKRIAIVGDLGLTHNSTTTVEHMRRNEPDLFILVGDASYANMYLTNGTGADCYKCAFNDTELHESYQPRWDYWGRYMETITSETPIMMIEGNHEIEEQAENKTFEAYNARFAFPSEESGSNSTFYYSFNAGGIHFIMLGGYTFYNRSGEQYKWLEWDLSKVDRKVTPWLIASWHPPWYSSYKAHYRQAECMRVEMEDILYSYGVDIVFTGHVHAYERSNRVYNYKLDPCGPVHITVGDGGNREKMAVGHADDPGECPGSLKKPDWTGDICAFNFTFGPAAGKFCWDRQPDYSAYRESSFGHGILEVKNETHALWTWHRNQDYYKKAGDQIYIVRQPDKCSIRLNSAAIGTQDYPSLIGEL